MSEPSRMTSIDSSRWSQSVRRPQSARSTSDIKNNFDPDRPNLTREWSREAVRGSWESSFQRSLSGSLTRERYSVWMESLSSSPSSEGTSENLIDDWLKKQDTEQPSSVIDAVSDLDSVPSQLAMVSPATSVASTSSEVRPTAKRPARSVAASSLPPRPLKRRTHGDGSGPTDRDNAAQNDLRGVGAFAQAQRPRYAASLTLLVLMGPISTDWN